MTTDKPDHDEARTEATVILATSVVTIYEPVLGLRRKNMKAEEVVERLNPLIAVLDRHLGDTDPNMPDDLGDDDAYICENHPVVWVMQRLVAWRSEAITTQQALRARAEGTSERAE